jgi:RimJ/RimL family protein N-acetyltransferase
MTRPVVPLPVLADAHVLLRAEEPRDLPAIDAGMHDPDVIRWIGTPWPLAEVLGRNEQSWQQGSPTFSICELDGTCVGLIWMNVRDPDRSTGHVGYWLLPAARGRGLATSAVRLLSAWAVRDLGMTRLRLTTAVDNPRSQRVAERSGFRRLSPAAGEPLDLPSIEQVVYALDEADFDDALRTAWPVRAG